MVTTANGTNGINGYQQKRPIRIGACSGATFDPPTWMYEQCKYGDVDFITGDWLGEVAFKCTAAYANESAVAEMNLAWQSRKVASGESEGYEKGAAEALDMSLELINEKRIKVVVNGGGLRPKALAEKVLNWVKERNLSLTVAYVSGDDLMAEAYTLLKEGGLRHLDAANEKVKMVAHADDWLDHPEKKIVSANAYLGSRAIVAALRAGADIVICGRVSDPAPVLGAAWYWHNWSDTDYDKLAQAFLAGHLIECSCYSCGANFSGFDRYDIPDLLDLSCPIAEISADGEVIITKNPKKNGFVTVDIIKCQFLYELQGDVYLNSDVSADLRGVKLEQVGENRVRMSGIKGSPPPPTTKFAIFYNGGWQAELTLYAAGYNTPRKFELFEAQLRHIFKRMGCNWELLEFQRLGIPKEDPETQLSSTTGLRVFGQSVDYETCSCLFKAWGETSMQHFSGMHCSLDFRTAQPMVYNGFYPGIIEQDRLKEAAVLLNPPNSTKPITIDAGHPSKYAPIQRRRDFETESPADIASFGETVRRPLGDVALGRSGDKGANTNLGLCVDTDEKYEWLRSYMTKDRLKGLMGRDWTEDLWLERCEMPGIRAVHFVIYGNLGRGVSSAARLDGLGKGVCDYIRARYVDIPRKFLSQ